MDIARSVAALLTWQWLILILALIFWRPLRKLFDRIVGIGVGGKKGIQAILAPDKGLEVEIGNVPDIGTPNPQDRIDVRLIVLRDSEGRERAKLGVTDRDAVSLTMCDGDGTRRMEISALAGNHPSVIELLSHTGKSGFLLRSGNFPLETLILANGERSAFIMAGVEADHGPYMDLVDADGNEITVNAPREYNR